MCFFCLKNDAASACVQINHQQRLDKSYKCKMSQAEVIKKKRKQKEKEAAQVILMSRHMDGDFTKSFFLYV